MLNPLVRDLTRLRLPRGLSVAVVVDRLRGRGDRPARRARHRRRLRDPHCGRRAIDSYLTEEKPATGQTGVEVDIDRLQAWLDDHGLEGIRIEKQLDDVTQSIGAGEVSRYAQDAISFAQGAAFSVILLLFSVVLIAVIAIYMLLDMPRLEASIDRRFPPHDGLPLTQRIERALWGYVRGQVILSPVIGMSAGVGMWILGRTGLVDGADRYALLFGVWTALIEVIPYIGPWLSAVPPAIYALFVDPIGVIWVAALFVFIYQIEGHVVVPNVMANALRLHPLLVIFGLLAGGELYGIAGVLVALPTMAAGRAIWEFFRERIELDSWEEGPGEDLPLDVELEPPAAREPRALTHPRAYASGHELSRDPAPAPASHRHAARARARDLALARRRRDAALRLPGRRGRPARRGAPGDRAALGRRARARGRRARARRRPRRPPLRDPRGEGRGRLGRLGRRRDRAARAAGAARRGARPDAAHRRLPLRVHRATVTAASSTANGRERRDARAPRAHGRQPRRGGRRRGRPERHDGRPGRRDPRGPARDADRLLRREVRLRVLRPVPRGRRVGARVRRPARLPDGPRERARGAPRVRARPRRGRRRPDGEARAAVPRRDPRRA